MKKDEKGVFSQARSDWESCKPMASARANFAIQVIKNQVYVFGGISGSEQGGEPWRPNLSATIIEKYMPQEDIWMTLKIPNTPSLAAFSWCTTQEGNLIILGGSDGNLLNSDMFIIDML